MTCMAVTKNGHGEVFLFESYEEADLCPIIQYGDVIMQGPDDLLRQYGLHELCQVLLTMGADRAAEHLMFSDPGAGHSMRQRREMAGAATESVWTQLERFARVPPEDPAEICRIIVDDRLNHPRKEIVMGTKDKSEAAEKKPRAKKFPDEHKITLLNDADGKPYGKANNPKREGTAAHGRFALYKSGMTVKKFVEAGGTLADVSNDVGKNYISVAA